MIWTNVFFALTAVSWCTCVRGSMQEQIAEYTSVCCATGQTHAQAEEDCTSAVPPRDIPKQYGALCLFAMDGCCKEHYKDKTECEKGKLLAPNKECHHISSDFGQTCCEECSLGRLAGSSEGRVACGGSGGVVSHEDEGSSTKLRKEAFTACCLEAASQSEPPSPKPPIQAPTGSEAASLCELFAPDELCAHHCIPVPGSYRCECNPGFMLMADGKSCKRVEKNRCKPHNPCQHKCNDNGKEVKCSCRRGYELLADKKSCKDIDECLLEMAVCASGTSCKNTEGSYKCISNAAGNGGSCPAGFKRNYNNQVCDDINECELTSPPCPKRDCVNTIGGYKCNGVIGKPLSETSPSGSTTSRSREEDLCPPGFKIGDDGGCADIDECAEHSDDCNKQSQFCLNTHGSFVCQDRASKHCAPGFKYNKATGVCQDIDECADSLADLCGTDQVCINVAGAYDCKPKTTVQPKTPKSCPEGTRYKPGGTICEDIDECREGTHLCDQFQDCLNTFGGHECRCKLGFRLDSTTGACADINECAEDSLNRCVASSQRCDNTVGSYVCTRFVSCGTGYVLHASSGQCEDIDECAHKLDNCARAGSEFTCVNLPGTFRCMRQRTTSTTTSTTLPPYEYEYYDSNEEITSEVESKPSENSPSPDAEASSPQNTTASSAVPPTPPTTTSEPPPVDYESSSRTVRPDPQPSPPERESSQPKSESNKPERESNEPNRESNKPESESNKPERESNEPNRESNKPAQRPEDNSTTGDLPPERPKEEKDDRWSTNAPQRVDVTPRPRSDNPKVIVLQPPKEPELLPSEADVAVVVDTGELPKNTWSTVQVTRGSPPPDVSIPRVTGSEEKHCIVGYSKNSIGECVDIDECSSGLHVCSSMTEQCKNTEGGYHCDCAPGFVKDQTSGWCKAFTTSTTTTTTTTLAPPASTVRNNWSPTMWPYRPFQPRLQCDVGYYLNSTTRKCEDVDECKMQLASCAAHEMCVNTDGGYRCECPPGWHLDDAGHRCVPARDPAQFPPGYANVGTEPTVKQVAPDSRADSTITVGSQYGTHGMKYVPPNYSRAGDSVLASCPWGYRLGDDGQCEDMDECARGNACGPTQLCSNYAGGYTCRCPPGHRLAGNNTCVDIDECAYSQGRSCSPKSECVNTIGSFKCVCHDGFRNAPVNDKVCADVDECAEARPGALCQHTCNNVWGSYRCSCHRGYKLMPDNRTCADVDECVEFASRRLCVGRCFNEPGSYRCSCPPGYRLGADSRSCIDIDECETGEATCAGSGAAPDRVCQNTRGGYKCHLITCPSGYQLERKHRCTLSSKLCSPGDWNCAHRPSTYSYNFITFVSNLYIPEPPENRVDLFTMRGPSWQNSALKFQLRLVNVNAPPSVRRPATIGCFQLTPSANQAVVSLLDSLEGPQSIELELSMELYAEGTFAGVAVAKIIIYVSEYSF